MKVTCEMGKFFPQNNIRKIPIAQKGDNIMIVEITIVLCAILIGEVWYYDYLREE